MTTGPILVTGGSGQLASALSAAAGARPILRVGRPEFDFDRPATLADLLRDTAPSLIVNAAAYTAVDKAEAEADLAQAINGVGAGAVAAAAARLGVPVIQISTDYVFDGAGSRAYVETDAVNPLSVYGASKLAGERAVAAANVDSAILRTSWVYSPFGANFARTMLRLAADREELGIVADQVGAPTSALDIADGVLAVARNLLARPSDAGLRGVFHMSAGEDVSWAGFAAEIFQVSRAIGGPSASVRPITTADYPTPARRPANSRLNSARLAERHGVVLPPWRRSVAPVVERLVRESVSARLVNEGDRA